MHQSIQTQPDLKKVNRVKFHSEALMTSAIWNKAKLEWAYIMTSAFKFVSRIT